MKSLANESILPEGDCTSLVMEAVPLLTRAIRREMRRQRPTELSMPQFRALQLLRRHPGYSLTQLAERLDLTLASASKLVDVLVKHALVSREDSAADRRRIELRLTPHGEQTLAAVWQATHARMTELIAQLSGEERAAVTQAMRALLSVMAAREGACAEGEGGGNAS